MNWSTVTKEKLLLLVSLKLSQPCTRKYGSMFVTSPTPSSHLTFGWQLETNAVIERKSVCTHIIKWLLDTLSLFPSPPTGTALWNKAIPFWKNSFVQPHIPPPRSEQLWFLFDLLMFSWKHQTLQIEQAVSQAWLSYYGEGWWIPPRPPPTPQCHRFDKMINMLK